MFDMTDKVVWTNIIMYLLQQSEAELKILMHFLRCCDKLLHHFVRLGRAAHFALENGMLGTSGLLALEVFMLMDCYQQDEGLFCVIMMWIALMCV